MPKQEATRRIDERVRCMLWGSAAERCECDGCNKVLYCSPVTQEQVNIAEAAHIWAFSPRGARVCCAGSEELYWDRPKDRTVADMVRLEILALLEKLGHNAQGGRK